MSGDSAVETVESRVPVALQAKGGLRLETLDEALRFATGVIKGNMAPRGISHAGAVVAIIQAGQEIGLPPMFSLSNLTFTNGRLGIMGDAAKALVRESGMLKPGTDIDDSYTGEPGTMERTAIVSAWRHGQPEPFTASFSVADAVRARLLKPQKDGSFVGVKRDGTPAPSSPWTCYPDRMLMYRAWGFLARDRFSQAMFGMVAAEELNDYPVTIEESATHRAETPPASPDPLLTQATAVEAEVVEEECPPPDPGPVDAAPKGNPALEDAPPDDWQPDHDGELPL